MKTKNMLMLMITFVLSCGSVAKASTEYQRYCDYRVACLEQIKARGGILSGLFYDSEPGASQIGTVKVGFNERFVNGVAKAVVTLNPGWYQAGSSWQEPVFHDRLFDSYYVEQTRFGAGLQAMPFLMGMNNYRSIRFKFVDVMPSDTDQVWLDGVRAWPGENGVWRAGIYKPWNVVGTEVQVIWPGHGGWKIQMTQAKFESVIELEAVGMDGSIQSSTKVKAINMLADSYLEDQNLIRYERTYYSEDLGCNVLEMEVGNPDLNIKELTVVLKGLDQGTGCRVSYYTAYMENVTGVFQVPLGDTSIQPQTEVLIYLTDPQQGDEYFWRWLDTPGLWYDNQTVSAPVVQTKGK